MKTWYWTVWGNYQVCSRHKTLAKAKKEAKTCESLGGAKHKIYSVKQIK